MLEIYFDGVLLNTDKYLGLTQKGKMFDKEFKLGTTISREFKLTIPKADFNPNTKRVLIKYNSNDYAHLIIDSYEYSEGGIPTVELTLVDKMVLADIGYDASPLVPTTTLGILQDICNKIGVVLGNTDFPNNDIVVDYYDNTMTARQYIGFIAEVAGGFVRIESDGKLYIRHFSNAVSTDIVTEFCEQILIGKKHRVERVVYDNGLNKMEKILQSKNLFNTSTLEDLQDALEFTNNDGIIELTAITNVGAQFLRNYVKNVDATKSYTLSFKAKKVVKGTDGTSTIRIMVYGSNDGETYEIADSVGTTTPEQGIEYSFVKTFKGYSHYRFYVYNNTSTPVTVGEKTRYYDIQFEEGVVATTYVPFGDIEKTKVGRNLFNINGNINDYFPDYSMTGENTVENGILTTNVNSNSVRGRGFRVRVNEGDVIRFSAKLVSKGTGSGGALNIVKDNKTQSMVAIGNVGEIKTNTYTVEKGVKEIICTFIGYQGVNAQFTDIIITKNNQDVTYEPYAENSNYLETVYLNKDNVYVTDEIIFEKLANKILGFEYWNIDTGKTLILPNTMSGDILKLTYENQNYYTIEQFEEINFMGVWQGSYKLEVDSGLQQETKVSGLNTQVKAIKVNLNRNENILRMAVSDISAQKDTNVELLNKINANQTLIEQTAQEINQSVLSITGALNDNIESLGDDLSQITANLQEQIIINQTLIKQLNNSITSTIKSTGGNNLLRNSAGLAGLDFWDTSGTVSDSQDSYTEQNTISGSKFILTGASSLKQTFNTQPGGRYGVSFKLRHIKKDTINPVYIRIHRSENDFDEVLVGEETTNEYTSFEEFNDYTYEAKTSTPYIEIINTGDDTLEISDLIVSIGENQPWSGYFDEVYGKEHRLDKYGLKLTDLASGDYISVTSNAVRLTDHNEVVAEISKEQAKSDTGIFNNKIQLRTLQMVALDDENIIEYA